MYSRKTVGELRKLCIERKIPECWKGGYLKKQEIISLLEEYDKKPISKSKKLTEEKQIIGVGDSITKDGSYIGHVIQLGDDNSAWCFRYGKVVKQDIRGAKVETKFSFGHYILEGQYGSRVISSGIIGTTVGIDLLNLNKASIIPDDPAVKLSYGVTVDVDLKNTTPEPFKRWVVDKNADTKDTYGVLRDKIKEKFPGSKISVASVIESSRKSQGGEGDVRDVWKTLENRDILSNYYLKFIGAMKKPPPDDVIPTVGQIIDARSTHWYVTKIQARGLISAINIYRKTCAELFFSEWKPADNPSISEQIQNYIEKSMSESMKYAKYHDKSPLMKGIVMETLPNSHSSEHKIIHFLFENGDVDIFLENDMREENLHSPEEKKSKIPALFEIEKEINKKASKKKSLDATKKKPPSAVQERKEQVYKTINLAGFKILQKRQDGAKERKKISITISQLRKKIDDPNFIKEFTEQVRLLMAAKMAFYRKKLDATKADYENMKIKVKRMKDQGADNYAIRELYPMYDIMGGVILDFEDLIETVKMKGKTTTEESIRDGLRWALNDDEDGIASLIGREDVMDKLASQLYAFSKGYKFFMGSFNNIMVLGPAGVGKTKLANVIAFAFSKVGILARDIVKVVTRADLVGQYIGQTAPRTRGVLLQTLDGVLFIDEAYQLTPCPGEKAGADFSGEAMTEIVNFLDKYTGMNMVIVAGYEDLMMECFLPFNEGLSRRFPYRYLLKPYSDFFLTDILVNFMSKKTDIVIDNDTKDFLYSVIHRIQVEFPRAFKNQAGDMLNLGTAIVKSIGSAFDVQWEPGNLPNNIPILLAGFDDFLSTKGIFVEFEE